MIKLKADSSKLIAHQRVVGGYSERVPPLPIPNREVKPLSADGTAERWESRSLPTQYNTQAKPHLLTRVGLSCVITIYIILVLLLHQWIVVNTVS